MRLLFATHNQNKFKEVKSLIPSFIELLSLNDVKIETEVEETSDTIEGNALLKVRTIHHQTGMNCFADDSGLLVEALNGAPGVYSARYAGDQKNDDDNIQKLISDLYDVTNRKAYFKTVIAIIIDGKEQLFEGIINGHIITEKRGNNGFGYDPIFMPDGYDKTFSEMNLATKNAISHRAIAFKKVINYLTTLHS